VLNVLLGLGISASLYGLFVGAAVGLSQGILSRNIVRLIPQWWIANLLAFVLGISSAGSFERGMLLSSGFTWGAEAWQSAVTAGISGIIVGLVTGIALVVLRHKPEVEHEG
jgi:zinc transporter ZupT